METQATDALQDEKTGSEEGWLTSRRCFLLIALLTTVCFANGLTGDFVQDDVIVIVKQPVLQSLANIPKLFTQPYWGPKEAVQGTYRPIVNASFALTYAVFGLQPIGYHLGNLMLHALNGWLIFLLARRYTGKPLVGLFTALIFTAHPVHVEAVTQVVGRAELLSACFFFLAWWFWLDGEIVPTRRYLSWLCFALALFAKENTVVWLGVVPLAEICAGRWRIADLPRRWIVPSLPYLGILGGYLDARWAVIGGLGVNREWTFFKFEPATVRCLTMVDGFMNYFRLMVFPVRLCALYDFSMVPKVSTPGLSTVFGLLVIGGLVGFGLWGIRRLPVAAFGVLVFFVAISPVSNILIVTGLLIAERVLYLPSVGFCFILGYGFAEFWRTRPAWRVPVLGSFLILCGLMGWRDVARNRDWANLNAFVNAQIRVNPRSPRTWTQAALVRPTPMEKEAAIRKAVELDPGSPGSRLELGRFLATQGKNVEAMAEFKLANERYDHSEEICLALAIGALRLGNMKEAETWYARAKELKPGNIDTYVKFGSTLVGARALERALEVYREALMVDPKEPAAFDGIGLIFLLQGRYAEAEQATRAGVALAPESDSLHSNLGVALLAQGKMAEARAELVTALRLNPGSRSALENLRLIERKRFGN